MASSKLLDSSVRKGQAAMCCQLCERDPKLKWKCLECELMMCQRCKDKIHSKIASAKDHKIIGLREISKHLSDPDQNAVLTEVKCVIHSKQNFCLYCNTCQTLVCRTCITKNHNKHDFREISDKYKIKLEKDKIRQRNIETEIQKLSLDESNRKRTRAIKQSTYLQGKRTEVDLKYQAKPQTAKTFATGLQFVTSVVSCPNGSVWICDTNHGTVQNVEPQGFNLSVISIHVIKVVDAALYPSGDLLLSVDGSYNLKLIPFGSSYIQDSLYKLSLGPFALHITGDQKVVVGAAGGATIFPVTGPRQVIVMDQVGGVEKIIQYDNHNKRLFTFPHRVTCDHRGYIAVIDITSGDFRGRVVVINSDGVVKNIYTGLPEFNHRHSPFRPGGITFTPSDNFVVADKNNHALHILNNEGEIITFYNTKEMGILKPYSLSFTTTGQLYIGSTNYGNSKENANLCKIDGFRY